MPNLIDRVLAGEDVVITRDGKPLVLLRPAEASGPPTGPPTYDWLTARRDARPAIGITSVDLLAQVYQFGRLRHGYLDASAVVPMLVREAASAAVDSAIRAWHGTLGISDFTAAEVASALSRLVRMGLLAEADARMRLADFDAWREADAISIQIYQADFGLSDTFVRRFELKLRAPDALHIAVCRRLDFTFVSLDRRQTAAARTLGISTFVPGDDAA